MRINTLHNYIVPSLTFLTKMLVGICVVAMFSTTVIAQPVSYSAKIDSAAIWVGQQTKLSIEWAQGAKENILLAIPLDNQLTKGIEIVNQNKRDTTQLSPDRIQIKQDIMVTSFDSGLYYIPAFNLVLGKDTFATNTLSLKVIPYEVDTLKAPFDIKGVAKAPFVFTDYAIWIGLVILIALLIWLAIFLYRRYKRKAGLAESTFESGPQIPPHQKALQALETIKKEKLWQNGNEKAYYTAITDVLRVYIQERYSVNAMEMTSFEISQVLRKKVENKEAFNELKSVLESADLVKFAKWIPLAEENELAILQAQLFVNHTKIEEVVADETTTPPPPADPQ